MNKLTGIWVLLSAYAVLVLLAIVALPLRVDEILRLIASTQSSFAAVLGWVKQIPGAAPLGDFTQFCVAAIIGHSQITARIPSLVLAVASCYFLWRLAQQTALQQPLLAVVLFMLMPLQYRYASDARPFELGMLLLICATLTYLKLLDAPSIGRSLIYGVLLVACLYTDPFSYFPAVGYLLFLMAFIARASKRRAFWHALPATVVPPLLFLPYYFWAREFVNSGWLYGHDHVPYSPTVYVDVLRELSGGGISGYVLSSLLLVAAAIACWRSFQLSETALSKRMALFSLFGGALATIAAALVIDATYGTLFSPEQILWAIPSFCILAVAAVDWLQQKSRIAALSLALLLLVLCVFRNTQLLLSPTENTQALEEGIRPQLTGDSCLVFVSQGLSPALFTFFDPELSGKQCFNFFHHRVVLASHRYVRPDQQDDAESFFRGLNFSATSRIHVGGGMIVTMEQKQ